MKMKINPSFDLEVDYAKVLPILQKLTMPPDLREEIRKMVNNRIAKLEGKSETIHYRLVDVSGEVTEKNFFEAFGKRVAKQHVGQIICTDPLELALLDGYFSKAKFAASWRSYRICAFDGYTSSHGIELYPLLKKDRFGHPILRRESLHRIFSEPFTVCVKEIVQRDQVHEMEKYKQRKSAYVARELPKVLTPAI